MVCSFPGKNVMNPKTLVAQIRQVNTHWKDTRVDVTIGDGR